MKFLRLIAVIICSIICTQIVRVSAKELRQFNSTNKQDPVEYPDVIIETILYHLHTKKLAPVPVNVLVSSTQISTTLGYSQQKIHAATSILKGEHIYYVFDRISALRMATDIVFDTISRLINSLERSVGTVCLSNFGIFDVQIALQVVVDVCFSSNWPEGTDEVPILYVETFSTETVSSSVYLLSSAIESFIASAANFAKTTVLRKEEVDKNLIRGAQDVVETVLKIVNDVLRGLKEMKGHERVFLHPQLVGLLTTIGTLASTPINLTEKITSPFTMIASTTQLNMKNLPLILDANIAKLLNYILANEQNIPKLNSTVDPITSLQSDLRDLSKSVHSYYKASDLSAYSLDASSQNLIASITYLTSSITSLPSLLVLFREFHELIEPNFQTDLLHITSNIQTLGNELTLFVEKQLKDLICASTSTDKKKLKENLMKLQSSVEPIILIFEKLVKSSIKTARNHMACILEFSSFFDVPGYDVDAEILFRDTMKLTDDLDRILNGDIISTSDNGFTICTEAFEEVAESSVQLRIFFNKSIQQIKTYLL